MSLDELRDELGIEARRLDTALTYLSDHPADLDGLVSHTGLTRRLAERIIGAGGPWSPSPPPDAVVTADLVAWLQSLIEAAPAPKRHLDHVSATADTLARRAVYLANRYALAGRKVLFLGDHDLTAFALKRVEPRADVVVADIDDDLLDFIDATAEQAAMAIVAAHADFTNGLPSVARDVDLVVTDPPYTAQGVSVFVARAVEALRSPAAGRIVMAYGYSPQHPALGLKVQRAVLALDCVIEYVLPGFNVYQGAQALGGRSDLYCLAPTADAVRAAKRYLASAGKRLYTHGRRSVESTTVEVGGDVVITHSLVDDHESALLRTMLRATDQSLAVLVPNSHPDIASEVRQRELTALTMHKYQLRFLRGQPSAKLAIVAGEAVDTSRANVLSKPNSTLATALADHEYKAARRNGEAVSRAEAAEAARRRLDELGARYGAVAVADLPRAVLRRLPT